MKKANSRSSHQKLVLAAGIAALGALLGAAAQAGTIARPMAAMPGMAPAAPAARGAINVLNPAGQTVKVGKGTPLASILAMPDNTVLEGANGARMTVGQFKREVQATRAKRAGPAPTRRSAKTIRVAIAGPGQSVALKIDAFRNAENTAAQSASSSATFNHGGQGQAGGQGPQAPLSKYALKPSMQKTCFGQMSGVGSVNGRRQGIVFTPGANYVIQGCGFGDQPGKAFVVERAVQIPLQIQSWNGSAIRASIDAGLSGVRDMSHATLLVQPARGGPLQQTGDQFYAARQSQPFVMPAQYIQLNSTVGWEPRYLIESQWVQIERDYCTGDSSCATLSTVLGQNTGAGPYRDTGKYCAGWPPAANDVWRFDEVAGQLAKSGFEIDYDKIQLVNTTGGAYLNSGGDSHPTLVSYMDWQWTQMGSISYSQQNGDLVVQFMGESYYQGNFTFGVPTSQYSDCYSGYRVGLSVTGPRGVPVPRI